MQSDGSYVQRICKKEQDHVCIHRELIQLAEKRAAAGRKALARKKARKQSPPNRQIKFQK
jgi:hypothetical protein